MSENWAGWQVHTIPEYLRYDLSGRIRSAREKRRAAEQWVRDRIKDDDAKLLAGHPDAPPTKRQVDDLLAEIDTFRGRELRWRRNYLLRALSKGARELGWPTFEHMPIVALHLRGSPLNAQTFPMIARFRRLRGAFIEHLQQTGQPPDATANATAALANRLLYRQGQLFLAAILFGGLASRSRLSALAEKGLQRIGVHQNWLWVDWNEAAEGAAERWGRWMADPLSGVLLAQALRDGLSSLQPVVEETPPMTALWLAIRAVLLEMPLAKEERPTSLTLLLNWARAWLFRYLPPFLAEYATGRLDTVSLPPRAWRRMVEGRPVEGEVADTKPLDTSARQSPQYNRSPTLPSDLEASAIALRNILRGQLGQSSAKGKQTRNPKRIRPAIHALLQQETLPPIVQLLAFWSDQRLAGQFGAATTATMVSSQHEAIDRLLMAQVGLDDLLSYELARVRSVYLAVMDASRSGQRHNVRAGALASFQRFLEDRYGASNPGDDLFDEVADDGGVDANCFSRADSIRIRDALSATHSIYPARLALGHQVAFLLSTRGTLRRDEILRLRTIDLQGETELILFRRERKDEPLKSNNSVRVVPLSALLSKDEVDLVRSYLGLIKDEVVQQQETSGLAIPVGDIMLFPKETDVRDALPESALFSPIREVMYAVTRDPTVRVHHGRHTSLAEIGLLLLETILPGCARLMRPDATLDDALQLQKALVGTTDPNTQHFWAVAAVAGQSSPDVTFGSYFHFCDWLLWYALEYLQPVPLEPRLVAAITGQPPEMQARAQRRLELSPRSPFGLVMHRLAGFADHFRVNPKTADATPATDKPDQGVQEAPIVPLSAPAPPEGEASPLNAIQLLDLLDELDTLLGARRSKGKKSKQSKGDATMTVETLARRYRIRPEVADRLWTIVGVLEGAAGEDGSSERQAPETPGHLKARMLHGQPLSRSWKRALPPRSTDERRRTIALFHGLLREKMRDPDALVKWLLLHLQHRDPDTNRLRFGDVKLALAWLAVWRAITADADGAADIGELGFTHYADGRAKALAKDAQIASWRSALQLEDGVIVSGKDLLKPKGQTGSGILEIALTVSKAPTRVWLAQKERKGISESRSRSASVAINAAAYAVVVLEILAEGNVLG
jgi:hypothetical protein